MILFGCFLFRLYFFFTATILAVTLKSIYTWWHTLCVSNDWKKMNWTILQPFLHIKYTSSTKSMCLYVFECFSYKRTLLGNMRPKVCRCEIEKWKKTLVIFAFTFISIFATLARVNEVWANSVRERERNQCTIRFVFRMLYLGQFFHPSEYQGWRKSASLMYRWSKWRWSSCCTNHKIWANTPE